MFEAIGEATIWLYTLIINSITKFFNGIKNKIQEREQERIDKIKREVDESREKAEKVIADRIEFEKFEKEREQSIQANVLRNAAKERILTVDDLRNLDKPIYQWWDDVFYEGPTITSLNYETDYQLIQEAINYMEDKESNLDSRIMIKGESFTYKQLLGLAEHMGVNRAKNY